MNTPLPWQRLQWQNVLERLRAGSLPHALLLSGPIGLGKGQFATLLAQTLLCETGVGQGKPCGQCRACLLIAAHSHPDLRLVSPVEEGKVIGVDQVREISQYLCQTSQYGGYKAVIIKPADQMNINAANSLLKTLEEPSAPTLILLVTAQAARLPATILSRCQRLTFTSPGAEEGARWLKGRIGREMDAALLLSLAEGAPMRALELAESYALPQRLQMVQSLERLALGEGDASGAAEQLLKIGSQQTLNWLYNWVADMIRHVSYGGERYMINRDVRDYLARLAPRAEPQALHSYLRQVSQALMLSGRQVNPQLLMETVLMAWQEAFLPIDRALRI